MIEILQAGWPVVLMNAVRGVVLLALAHAGLGAFSRGPATHRDFAWTATFGALFALPFVLVIFPAWELPLAGQLFDGRGSAATATLLGAGWAVGVLGVVAYFAVRHAQAAVLRASAAPLEDADWTARCASAASRLGLDRRVEIRCSSRVSVPLVVRACLLVPRDAREWDAARRDIVLLHELSHIRRADFRTKLLIDLGCALHWFDPLAWLARRRATVAREQACDDAVLQAGVGGREYAGQLLHFARRVARSPGGVVAGLPMARPSSLEVRLRSVLDDGRNRRNLTLHARLLVGIAVLAAGLSIGAATLDRPAPEAPPWSSSAPAAPSEWSPPAASPEPSWP